MSIKTLNDPISVLEQTLKIIAVSKDFNKEVHLFTDDELAAGERFIVELLTLQKLGTKLQELDC